MRQDSFERTAKPLTYFFYSLSWSWFFWLGAAWLSRTEEPELVRLLHFLGGAGPLLMALLLLYTRESSLTRRDFWLRVIDWRRIRAPWYLVILGLPLLTAGTAAGLDYLLGGEGLKLEVTPDILTHPLLLLRFSFFILIFGPVPEELGWRGYGLDKLQAEYSALPASFLLGTFWALWHLPLFWIQGTYQAGLGIGTVSFWLFLLELIPLAVIFTWIYNNCHRSILAAILLHFMVNFNGELLALSARADRFEFGVVCLIAILIIHKTDAATLLRKISAS
ncbi:MAG: CPBP family intramembrane metalloprotease [Candidatus Cloacimonetes bacterium]|nr:CPBP family intramembrane metalloprotease [Candidatus Cloacimonadota bacterium]